MDCELIPQTIFRNLPTLETSRLILRKMTLDDAADMFEYASDPAVSRYTLWNPHRTIKDSEEFLKGISSSYEKGLIENWGIALKENNKFIGTCGYFYWNQEFARAEIQYAMSGKYWGKGLMTEAVCRVLEFGFTEMKLNRVEARCMLDNIGSERVMQKNGMKFKGIARQAIFAKEKYFDLKVYAILKSEFNGQACRDSA